MEGWLNSLLYNIKQTAGLFKTHFIRIKLKNTVYLWHTSIQVCTDIYVCGFFRTCWRSHAHVKCECTCVLGARLEEQGDLVWKRLQQHQYTRFYDGFAWLSLTGPSWCHQLWRERLFLCCVALSAADPGGGGRLRKAAVPVVKAVVAAWSWWSRLEENWLLL